MISKKIIIVLFIYLFLLPSCCCQQFLACFKSDCDTFEWVFTEHNNPTVIQCPVILITPSLLSRKQSENIVQGKTDDIERGREMIWYCGCDIILVSEFRKTDLMLLSLRGPNVSQCIYSVLTRSDSLHRGVNDCPVHRSRFLFCRSLILSLQCLLKVFNNV